MISGVDIEAMKPETRTLDTDRQDWRDHLWKIVTHGGIGTRVIYWTGPTDVDPSGKRKEVFEAVRVYGDRVHLFQGRLDGGYQYMFEVR